jgi:hypothetical protein
MMTDTSSHSSIEAERQQGMRFQPRDGLILWFIYLLDGVVGRRHIKDMYWPNATQRAMLRRLSLLVQYGYLDRPSMDHRKSNPYTQAVYWLGWKGIIWIAQQLGVEVDLPKNLGENQMRTLEGDLRKQGIHWLREPKWGKLQHDLAVVDFRLALERSANELPAIGIEQWTTEREFRSNMDRIEFRAVGKGGKITKGERGVIPDFFVIIADEDRKREGRVYRLPLLLEIDMASHPVKSRFSRQKIAPYAAYIRSSAYRERFGLDSGNWLIVTSGERRMENLMKRTVETLGSDAGNFFFTVIDRIGNGNLLTSPIWLEADGREKISLLSV